MNANLAQWIPDGRGVVRTIGEREFEVRVETPFTLWCPDEAAGSFRLAFDCQVCSADSAMLVLAGARAWRGAAPVLRAPRTGRYDDYATGDLELYTIGFNRTGHVRDTAQPNASTANVRRIGGARSAGYSGARFRLGQPDADLALWREWDALTLLASAREFASGTAGYLHYEFRFEPPRIRMFLEGQELLAVVDHLPGPLAGGAFGLRNMTPGAAFRIRNLEAEPA